MSLAYIVTEGVTDVEILRTILPAQIVQDTGFVAGSGKYSAQSLATSLLAVKQHPVALVIDADTENPMVVREKLDFSQALLRQVASGVRFAVLAAVPELESVFFQDQALLERLTQHTFTEMEWQAARRGPKAALTRLLDTSSTRELLSRLTEEDIRVLQQHPLVSELGQFLHTSIDEQRTRAMTEDATYTWTSHAKPVMTSVAAG